MTQQQTQNNCTTSLESKEMDTSKKEHKALTCQIDGVVFFLWKYPFTKKSLIDFC